MKGRYVYMNRMLFVLSFVVDLTLSIIILPLSYILMRFNTFINYKQGIINEKEYKEIKQDIDDVHSKYIRKRFTIHIKRIFEGLI